MRRRFPCSISRRLKSALTRRCLTWETTFTGWCMRSLMPPCRTVSPAWGTATTGNRSGCRRRVVEGGTRLCFFRVMAQGSRAPAGCARHAKFRSSVSTTRWRTASRTEFGEERRSGSVDVSWSASANYEPHDRTTRVAAWLRCTGWETAVVARHVLGYERRPLQPERSTAPHGVAKVPAVTRATALGLLCRIESHNESTAHGCG
jgi:hypothetical protein